MCFLRSLFGLVNYHILIIVLFELPLTIFDQVAATSFLTYESSLSPVADGPLVGPGVGFGLAPAAASVRQHFMYNIAISLHQR